MEEETKLETPEEKAHRKERERFMRQAITQAKKAEKLMEVPIGCVIVYEGKVIARGYNRRNTDKNTLSHAELNAIRKASKKLGDWRLEGCTLYVTLEPCQMCAGAIVQARVSEVIIGSMNPKAGCAGSILNMLEMHEFNHQVKVERGVLKEECSEMLSAFFQRLRVVKKKKKEETVTKQPVNTIQTIAEEKTPYMQNTAVRPQISTQTTAPEPPKQMELFEDHLLTREAMQKYKVVGQVFETYWLVEYDNSLYIIDQHAAHERVLYEKTLKSMQTREFTSQMISPPIVLNLSMREAELLNTYMDRFTRIGFEIEEFGQDSYAVRAVPDNLFSIAKKELLIQMLDSLSDEIARNQSPDLIDEKIASMSCKAAVKGNMKLSVQEVDALIGELLSLDNPYHCPHGRPTIIAMTKRELEKKFKRIV